jgi:gluconokinase
VAGLRADFDEAVTYQRTGCRFHPSYLPARLRWLARTYPADFGRVTRWLSLGEYVAEQLFGETAVSYSVASWSGLLNRHTLTWDEDLLAHLPLQADHLSPLVDIDQPQRGLRPEFAQRWLALRDVPWFATVGDGAAANIGSGCFTAERVALTIGTTSALRVVIAPNVPPVPEGLWCYRVDGQRSLLGGALSEGGNLLAWLRDRLQLGEEATLNEQLTALEPDSHGLTVLPFLAGERSPGWAGGAKATLHGLTLATTPVQIVQACLEAVAYRIALVLQRMQGELSGEARLIVSGGALQHWPAWTQIIADVLGRPLLVSDVSEASGRGAALLALEALGATKLADLTPSIVAEFAPRPAYQDRYQAAIARQEQLYHALISTAP